MFKCEVDDAGDSLSHYLSCRALEALMAAHIPGRPTLRSHWSGATCEPRSLILAAFPAHVYQSFRSWARQGHCLPISSAFVSAARVFNFRSGNALTFVLDEPFVHYGQHHVA